MTSFVVKGSKAIYETCIGIEVHAQIISNSKLFSGATVNTSKIAKPNHFVSFTDAAFPGMLPRLNEHCVHQTVKTCLALHSDVQNVSRFERKHYFYCDMPQGYQITQQRDPISVGGYVLVDSDDGREKRKIRVTRVQIEQDSGKSIHDLEDDNTMVDLNRAGTGLMEIVMEPDVRSPKEAGTLLKTLQHLLRHIGTCDGNMESGSMRCDLNVSVRKVDDTKFGDRVEVKNMNSVRHLMRAAEFEANRQVEEIERGGVVRQETRAFDAVSGATRRLRSKEGKNDYRFFPEPDLHPLVVQQEDVHRIEKDMPELPDRMLKRICAQYDLSDYEGSILLQDIHAVHYFEQVAKGRPHKMVANWVINNLFALLKSTNTDITECPVSPQRLGELLDNIKNNTISGKMAKELLLRMYHEDSRSPKDILQELGWSQISTSDAISEICESVLKDPMNAKEVSRYHAGETKLFGHFVGLVMKKSKGKVNPKQATDILRALLS